MLLTNTRLSKLSAFRRSLITRGLLSEPHNLTPPTRQQPPNITTSPDPDGNDDPPSHPQPAPNTSMPPETNASECSPPGVLNHVVLALTRGKSLYDLHLTLILRLHST